MDASTSQELDSGPPEGGTLVTTSGFCAACDSRFANADAYRFDAIGGAVFVEARHYAATATGSATVGGQQAHRANAVGGDDLFMLWS